MNSKVDSFVAVVTRSNQPIAAPILKLGGNPVFVSQIEQPNCRHCDQPMDFIGQIPLDAPLKFSRRFKMAYVFMCPGKFDGRGWLECETWRPFSGANAVLLQEEHGPAIIRNEELVRYSDYSIVLSPLHEPNIDCSDSEIPEDLLEQVSGMTKLGGVPSWIQNNETPSCPVCQRSMRFIAQIDAELDGSLPADSSSWSQYSSFEFGDAGLGYVFICPEDCSTNGAFLWQSG